MRAPDIRWAQRFDNRQRAFARWREASALAELRGLADLQRQGLIQGIEFAHDFAWITFKVFLSARGVSVQLYGSRDATRTAIAAELIEDAEAWMKVIEHRNESSQPSQPRQRVDAWAAAQPDTTWRRLKARDSDQGWVDITLILERLLPRRGQGARPTRRISGDC